MHGKRRHSDIYGIYARFSRSDGADGAAAGHVIAHNKRLMWHLYGIANRLKQSDGMTVTGIALICIELDYWPAIQNRSVFVIMPFKVVWMHAMGIID